VKVEPLKYEPQCALWKIAADDTALDTDRDLVLSVHSMEMRRRMLPREDADHDAKESGYLSHRSILPLVCLLINSVTRSRSAVSSADPLKRRVRPATASLRSLPRLRQLGKGRRCRLDSAHRARVIDLLAALRAVEVPQVSDHVPFPRVAIGPILLDCPNPRGSTCGTGRNVEWSLRLRHHNALFEDTRK